VMLALCKMRFGNSCLPFDLEIQAEERQKQRHEETAARLIQCAARIQHCKACGVHRFLFPNVPPITAS
jgi:hypothetical protein